jgi:DNA-binding beta-propeller fold protein YncE
MNRDHVRARPGRFVLAAALLTLAACGGGGGGGGNGGPSTAAPASRLYVSGGNTIRSYDNAATISGTVPPNRTVVGAATGFAQPQGIAMDMARNEVYVANRDGHSILVFGNASTATGDLASSRTVVGAATLLFEPQNVFFDAAQNRLYVANGNDKILVFDNAGALSGDTAPARVIAGAATTLDAPWGIQVDATRDKLYVSNFNPNTVTVFDNAGTVNGDVAPSRTISVAPGTLENTADIFVDAPNDRLYVTGRASRSIVVIDSASTANGEITPSRTIAGVATQLNGPVDIFVDIADDRLYVLNQFGNAILVFDNAASVDGDTAPSRTLALPAGADHGGIFVDVTPIVLPAQAALDGVATDNGGFNADGVPLTVGDLEPSTPPAYRGFTSFDVSRIPSTATLLSAELRLYQYFVGGSPYSDLGNVIVDHMDYGASLTGAAYNAAALASNIGTLSTSATLEYKTLDVTGRLRDDIATGRPRSQYRLRFSLRTNSTDGSVDAAFFQDAEMSGTAAGMPPQLVIRVAP